MQTTLLGIAIALILALVAALVGPHFVDWSRYRVQFETQASRLTGLTVLVNGTVEARLLPTPALTFGGVEIARPGDSRSLRARSVSLEFSLGALTRGEWRASHVRIDGAEFAAGLDTAGRLDWPAPVISEELETLSIERLDIVDSRALLADATSGSRLLLEKLEFRGELRSRLGPVKGEGSFVLAGHHYPFRIAANRAGDGGVRVRLNVDPVDRPLIAEADALFVIKGGVPHYDGSIQLTRPVGRAPDGIIQPWRVATRIRGDSSSATLEQIEFQYGPEERAIKLRGDANLAFGREPRLVVGLASTQIDLDRLLGLSEATRKRPLLAVKTFADYFGGAQRPPIPVRLGISIENVTLAGGLLQRVSGEVVGDTDNWNLDVLDFRAPGATQVGLSGRLNMTPGGVTFDGRAKVEARDPRALAAWLTDRPETVTAGALRAEGDVKLGSDHVAIDGLTAEIDRMTMVGRLAYTWPRGERPPRIEAELSAPDVDFDRAYALAQSVFADTPFERPREGTLSLKVGHAAIAGVEAKQADIDLQFERGSLDIRRLDIRDFGGAALSIKGRVDGHGEAPRGAVTFDLDARALDGIAMLIEKVAPQAAAEFRRRVARLVPAKVQASVMVGATETARPGAAKAAFKLDGSAGAFKIALQGQADAGGAAFSFDSLPELGKSKLKVTGRLDAADAGALMELLSLDTLVAVGKRPGRLDLSANGAVNGEMAVDAQLVAGDLDVSSKGTVRLADGAVAGATIRIANAKVRSPRPGVAGQPAETLPLDLDAKLAFAAGTIDLTDMAARAANSEVVGSLKIGLAQPVTVTGDLDVAEIDLPFMLAAATGSPRSGAAAWPAEPFDQGLLGEIGGRLTLRSAHVALSPRLAAKNVRGIVRLDQGGLSITEIDGTLAGGRFGGELMVTRGADGISAQSRLRVAGADITELVRGGPPPMSGRFSAELDLQGTGRSPVALIGALKGGGTFTLEDAGVQWLDPGAFDAVITSVDQGLQLDIARIRERMDQALAAGSLTVARAEGDITVVAGQARALNVKVGAQGADLAVNGSALLADDTIDTRLTLLGLARADALPGVRPEVTITLKGAPDAPKRTLDVTAFSNWLALRAVEQQSKRIDALEAARQHSVDAPTSRATPAPTPRTPPTPPQTQARPRSTQPATGSTRPQQPLDLRPPSLLDKLDNLFGR